MVDKYNPDLTPDYRRMLLESLVSGLVPYVGGTLVNAMRINKPLESEKDMLEWIEQVTNELNNAAAKLSEVDQRNWASGVFALNGDVPVINSSFNISSIVNEAIGVYSVNFGVQPPREYQVSVQCVEDAQAKVENSLGGFRVSLKSPNGQPVDSGFSFQVILHHP